MEVVDYDGRDNKEEDSEHPEDCECDDCNPESEGESESSDESYEEDSEHSSDCDCDECCYESSEETEELKFQDYSVPT